MKKIVNLLSLSRVALAFFFLSPSMGYRLLAIVTALITDGLDGFLARRFQVSGRFGRIIDPLTDRFFLYFAAAVLLREGMISPLAFCALGARDGAIFGFALLLCAKGAIGRISIQPLFLGKLTTVLQFLLLIVLVMGVPLPEELFILFLVLGGFVFVELFVTHRALLMKDA